MAVFQSIQNELPLLTRWRREIHTHPELAFQETRTADFIATQLEACGVTVTRQVGKTGVVGTLRNGNSSKALGLRADMDALPMEELNSFTHKSKNPGCMHGCGHDGHTVMLLAAVRYLQRTKQFNGTVQCIFQPAEEANDQGSGAQAMINDGLFERFPADCVFALHNNPLYSSGVIATRPGAFLASMDLFSVKIKGRGAHGAYPHLGTDPIAIAAAIINAWQSIVSRNVSAQESAVISVGSVTSGEGFNVIPHSALIKGSIRTLSLPVQTAVKERFLLITQHIAEGFGASVEIDFNHAYPITANEPAFTELSLEVAATVVGRGRVMSTPPPVMGSEDFAYMLKEKPGCYLWLGSGPEGSGEIKGLNDVGSPLDTPCMLHDPRYDFNDAIIPIGASFLAGMVERYLAS